MTSATLRQARHVIRRQQAREIETRIHADIEARMARAGGYHARRRQGPFRLRLWLPVSLLWALFPLVILFSPVALAWRGNPVALITAMAALLAGLPGCLVEVEGPDADIHIRLV
jgi:hypothetical protein